MFFRSGLVSNSSSTSFVLKTPQDLARFKAFFPDVSVFYTKDILAAMASFQSACKSYTDFLSGSPGEDGIRYLARDYGLFEYGDPAPPAYYDEILALHEATGGVYITSPVDRDDAYRMGVSFPVFEDDL